MPESRGPGQTRCLSLARRPLDPHLDKSTRRMTRVIPAPAAQGDAVGVMKTPSSNRPRGAGPFARFRRDHTRVLGWLASMEAIVVDRIQPMAARALLGHLTRLRRQFESHMAAEEAVIYPTLAAAFPEARAGLAPLRDEHADLKEMLASLETWLGKPPGHDRDVQIAVQVRDFAGLMRCHVQKEETLVFDVTERVLEERGLRELASHLAPFAPALGSAAGRPPVHPTRGPR